MGDKDHHVHFSGGSGLGFNNIMIQPQRHGHLDAHLGFLQRHHRYHIEFSIPWNKCIHADDKSQLPAAIVDHSSSKCTVNEVFQEKDDLRIKLELLAYDEFLKEVIKLKCCESGTPLNVAVKARVLSRDKGTPVLRNGIHSIGIEPSEDQDDEESD
ncbi:uncharacterized protein LOC103571681 [Microplitis demolitor]|uniref:uncharacterized protein LOC103571681 n=1 Tax=Microplitis demolitor TaxID=69319 RepID=UPI00043FFFA0|nr:uncharacterized protein LOC103571681 [Microplitis demolitor]